MTFLKANLHTEATNIFLLNSVCVCPVAEVKYSRTVVVATTKVEIKDGSLHAAGEVKVGRKWEWDLVTSNRRPL